MIESSSRFKKVKKKKRNGLGIEIVAKKKQFADIQNRLKCKR
jgi:hypothetical protein